MLQVKLFSVTANFTEFVGSTEMKLPFQILQVRSANRAPVHFKHLFHTRQLDMKKQDTCRQQLSTRNHKMEFPINGCGAVILKAACPEPLVCICY